jgi:hypothetical protein
MMSHAATITTVVDQQQEPINGETLVPGHLKHKATVLSSESK